MYFVLELVVLQSTTKEFMGGIDHVKKTILVSLLLIDLTHVSGHTGKALIVDQQIKCLCV